MPKYSLSKTKHQLAELNISNLRFLVGLNHEYTNAIDLTATQFLLGAEIQHKIRAVTFDECMEILIKRAESIQKLITATEPRAFEVEAGNKNLIGHLKDGNVDFINDSFVTNKDSK